MTARNLGWLRSQVSLLVNFNPTQPDQDFSGTSTDTYASTDSAINMAYRQEVAAAMNEASTDFFKSYFSWTWSASTLTMKIPEQIRGKQLQRIDDETTMVPGETLWIMDREGMRDSAIFWRDFETLQWGTQGPGENKILTAYYVMDPEDLVSPVDEPRLIPNRHRDLIVWRAASLLRAMADDSVPGEWLRQTENLRMAYWADLARGAINNPVRPGIRDPYMGRG